jgi:hypothetical protein
MTEQQNFCYSREDDSLRLVSGIAHFDEKLEA